jgi:hypothetical protein
MCNAISYGRLGVIRSPVAMKILRMMVFEGD